MFSIIEKKGISNSFSRWPTDQEVPSSIPGGGLKSLFQILSPFPCGFEWL